jgi:calcineurin-like phosphoesterase family protein
MNTFFTSDPHYGHENILTYENRPFKDIYEMNDELIRRWNSVVKDGDLVYVLGDLTLEHPRDIKFIKQLKGNKILIYGNHDSTKFKNRYKDLGFLDCLYEVKMKIAGQTVILNHFPYRFNFFKNLFYQKILRRKVKYYNDRPSNKGLFLLHGHTHSEKKSNGRMIHVGVDAWNFYPVHISMIEAYINTQLSKEQK